MSEISEVIAREIIDSRGNPDARSRRHPAGRDVRTRRGSLGRLDRIARGGRAARQRRGRYSGKGVEKAVRNVNRVIGPSLEGLDVTDQVFIDTLLVELDGTDNKKKLGANAILGVSIAVARAASELLELPLYRYLGGVNAKVLPVPMMNILNGGAHADNNVDIQEFMVVPVGATTFREALRCGAEVFHALKAVLKGRKLVTAVGDEGGFAPNLRSNAEALEVILEAIVKSGRKPGKDVLLALDVAASELFTKGRYHLAAEKKPMKGREEMVRFYEDLVRRYPIVSIEDGFAEGDWAGWKLMTQHLARRSSSSATTSSSPIRPSSRAASARESPTRS
jgi:enolase